LVPDIVGYSRLAGADKDRILARLGTLRSDLIDPILAVHRGRVVKRAGDGAIIEFRSVVDAVRCAIEVQSGLAERKAGLPPEKRIEYRVGIHLGDVVIKPTHAVIRFFLEVARYFGVMSSVKVIFAARC
jgi:class 3 adenylate cyclase